MDKKYTIIIVPPKLSKVKRYRLSGSLPRVILYCSLILTLAFAYGIYDYLKVKREALELHRLKKIDIVQKAQLRRFAEQIQDLKRQMAKVKILDKKLRVIANLEPPSDSDISDLPGIGGPLPYEEKSVSIHERSHEELARELNKDLEMLGKDVRYQQARIRQLHDYLQGQKVRLAHTPSIWPVKGWIASGFGYRRSPFTGRKEFHQGLDIATRKKAPIIAPADGVVTFKGREGGYGNVLTINHGYGYVTRYGHLSKALVKEGQKIKRGQRIALVGNTGRTTGPHLHYEIQLNGVPVNPRNFILD